METTRQPRIVIEDLPVEQPLTEEEKAAVYGAGRFQLNVEQLEDRQLMSASAVSNLGGIVAKFQLNNQQLVETVGQQQTTFNNVQGLFQGLDAAGHQVVYDWSGGNLNEFTGTGWQSIGAADYVAQGGSAGVFFTEQGKLEMATGVPATGAKGATALLNNVQVVNGQMQLQIGTFLTANVAVSENATSGVSTIGFTNIKLNTGDFLNNVAKDLQNVTGPLQNLVNTLSQPLLQQSWASSLTAINLLNMYNPSDGQALQTFMTTVTNINTLKVSQTSTVTIPNFQIQIGGTSAPTILSSTPNFLSGVTAALSPLEKLLPGLQVSLDQPQQLLNILMGAKVNLFSYPLTFNVPVANFDQLLAAIPISPETATELDLDLVGNLNISGGATFGCDTTGLQTGNLANGFYVQNANVTVTGSLGLAGTINEAYLVGVRLTGELVMRVQASLPGTVYANQSNFNLQYSLNKVSPQFVTSTLGPQDLLGQYLTPQAAAAAEKALNNGVNNAATALGNAYNSEVAKNAQLLSGVGKTAGAITTALQGLYSQPEGLYTPGAAQTAAMINNLDSAAATALKNGAATLHNVNAKILSDVSNSANDIAGVLKGAYGMQAGQIAATLAGVCNGISMSEIAKALSSTGAPLPDIAKALWNTGVTQYFSGAQFSWVAGALSAIDSGDFGGIAKALLSAAPGNFGAVASALAGGINGIHLSDIAKGLSAAGASLSTVATSLWNTGVTQYFSGAQFSWVAGALSAIDSGDFGGIAKALLSAAPGNFGAVASALAGGINGIHLSDIAKGLSAAGASLSTVATSLWNTGVTQYFSGAQFSWVAGALSAIDSGDFGGIAKALLSAAPGNFGAVASALAGGINGIHLSDIAKGLSAAGASLSTVATSLWNTGVTQYFSGAQFSWVAGALSAIDSGDFGGIAKALLSAAPGNFGAVASALAGGINGIHLSDIAKGLSAAGASLSTVATSLWNTGVTQYFSGAQFSWVAGALSAIDSGDFGGIAKALLSAAPGNFGAVASALAGGINGIHLSDIAKGLSAAGASLSTVATSLWNTGVTQYFSGAQFSWVAGALSAIDSGDFGGIAKALLSAAPGNFGAVASALAGGINGIHLSDIAKGLSAAGASLSTVATSLWNTGVTQYFSGAQFSWVAGALSAIDSGDFGGIAKALLSAAPGNFGAVASALAGGINGIHLSDIAKGLSAAGASLSTVATSLWNTGVTQYFSGAQLSWVASALYTVTPNWLSVAHGLADAGIMSLTDAFAFVGLNSGGGGIGGILGGLISGGGGSGTLGGILSNII